MNSASVNSASLALDKFKEFLEAHPQPEDDKSARMILDMNEIRHFNKELATFILNDPSSCLPWFEEELSATMSTARNMANKKSLGFVGSLGAHTLTPRSIGSVYISKMICAEGIVTSVSLIRPKLRKSVHYSETDKDFYEKEYRDGTMITKLPPTNFIYPLKDSNGHSLLSEFGLSEYVDFQTVQVQEMPENSPPGQLPRSVECVLTEDLVDRTKPGDRVRVYGIFKSFCPNSVQFPTQFRTILIANNVQTISSTGNSTGDNPESTPDERLNSFRLLASSGLKYSAIAPTIFGHSDIKKALALLMVGGNEVIMKNGSRIRGDINILLVGDPSTAKSQLLRYALNFMPLSIATTGRGSSGVGLTAAVVLDKDTGDKRLEAGAMVLADRGLVCIDEFDKMSPLDRIAIHEVMEQQTVTIAKAGIHTTLNARCAVLAAANPVLGSYSERMSVQDNIRLPESLLTRFDLIFITLDEYDSERDDAVSRHVLKMHGTGDSEDGDISQTFFRDFILYARGLRPRLSREAASVIAREYARLREKKDSKGLTTAITPRLLETLIRLSTAHAKLRLSEEVAVEDAESAISLLGNNLVKKVSASARDHKRVCNDRAESGNSGVRGDCKDTEHDVITLGQRIREEIFEKIRNGIFEWKTNNPDQGVCTVEELAGCLNFAVEDVEGAVERLSEEKHLHYSNKTIFFFE